MSVIDEDPSDPWALGPGLLGVVAWLLFRLLPGKAILFVSLTNAGCRIALRT
jgi:hypothetical protein